MVGAGGRRHRSLCMTFCTLGQFYVHVQWWTRNGNAPGRIVESHGPAVQF